METFAAQFINGMALGAIYALLVTGFNLLLVVGGIFQFAYSHVVVMSMYVCWMVLDATGGNIVLGVLAAIGSGIAMSLGTEPIFRPLARRGAAMISFILSLGIAMIITDMMKRKIHHGIPVPFPELSSMEPIFERGVATITLGQMATFVGCGVAVAVFLYMLYQTRRGRALRVMAQEPTLARLIGIPILRTSMFSYLIAGILGGISAVFIAMSLGIATSTLGDLLAIKVFAVSLLAGLGNLRGGLIAAFIVGLAEGMTAAYLVGDWANAVAFGIIIAVVLFRPQGLFGLRT